ncbi:MAG: hypothetical protein ACHBN1_09455 [Heteroscytonema crispum UTEX LB 1556]
MERSRTQQTSVLWRWEKLHSTQPTTTTNNPTGEPVAWVGKPYQERPFTNNQPPTNNYYSIFLVSTALLSAYFSFYIYILYY